MRGSACTSPTLTAPLGRQLPGAPPTSSTAPAHAERSKGGTRLCAPTRCSCCRLRSFHCLPPRRSPSCWNVGVVGVVGVLGWWGEVQVWLNQQWLCQPEQPTQPSPSQHQQPASATPTLQHRLLQQGRGVGAEAWEHLWAVAKHVVFERYLRGGQACACMCVCNGCQGGQHLEVCRADVLGEHMAEARGGVGAAAMHIVASQVPVVQGSRGGGGGGGAGRGTCLACVPKCHHEAY